MQLQFTNLSIIYTLYFKQKSLQKTSLTFCLLLVCFASNSIAFDARGLLKDIVKKKIINKTPLSHASSILGVNKSKSGSYKSINGIFLDGRKLKGPTRLYFKHSRFYFEAHHLFSLFGVKSKGNIFQKNNFILQELEKNLFKNVLNLKLFSFSKKYPVREVAQLLGYNVVYNKRSKYLKFFTYPKSKHPLKKQWVQLLAKKGLEKYLKKLEKLKPKKTPKRKPTIPKKKQKVVPSGYSFQNIYATSFEAQTIASKGKRGDWYMRDTDLGVALPSRDSLNQWVQVYFPDTGKSVVVEVIDVGPWNIDDPYWVRGKRPAAETGTDAWGRKTNLAGIDLSYQTWLALGVSKQKAFSGTFSGTVHWKFVE
ncbi:MAG: hypothetical protein KC646_07740 [Candidatus Cloacimonetes bacterium]|nr:hypothetical protein [Candidatus Cloacimonadota bacterium]